MTMPNGFWSDAEQVIAGVDKLNACLLQVGNGEPPDWMIAYKNLVYRDEDTSKIWQSNGTSMEVIIDANGAAATPSLRSLGAGGASPYIHSHIINVTSATGGQTSSTSTRNTLGTSWEVLRTIHGTGTYDKTFVIIATLVLGLPTSNLTYTSYARIRRANITLASTSVSLTSGSVVVRRMIYVYEHSGNANSGAFTLEGRTVPQVPQNNPIAYADDMYLRSVALEGEVA